MVTGLQSGVTAADTTRITSSAILHSRCNRCGLTMPRAQAATTSSGVWNPRPIPTSSHVTKCR